MEGGLVEEQQPRGRLVDRCRRTEEAGENDPSKRITGQMESGRRKGKEIAVES